MVEAKTLENYQASCAEQAFRGYTALLPALNCQLRFGFLDDEKSLLHISDVPGIDVIFCHHVTAHVTK